MTIRLTQALVNHIVSIARSKKSLSSETIYDNIIQDPIWNSRLLDENSRKALLRKFSMDRSTAFALGFFVNILYWSPKGNSVHCTVREDLGITLNSICSLLGLAVPRSIISSNGSGKPTVRFKLTENLTDFLVWLEEMKFKDFQNGLVDFPNIPDELKDYFFKGMFMTSGKTTMLGVTLDCMSAKQAEKIIDFLKLHYGMSGVLTGTSTITFYEDYATYKLLLDTQL